MKFSICNETFNDRTLVEGFQLAREIGYTGIELAPFTLSGKPEQPLTDVNQLDAVAESKIRDSIIASEMETVGLHWLFAHTAGFHLTSPDASVQKATAEYLTALATLCENLGGGVMVLGSPQQRNLLPGVTYEQAEDIAVHVIRSALPVLEDCGVTLAIEPLGPSEGDFLNTAASAVKLVDRLGSRFVRLHLDVKAMASEVKPMAEIIHDNRDQVAHFHANDPNLLGPGMGEVDFQVVADALRLIDYDQWISVEVFRYEPTPESIARGSFENLVEYFGRQE